MCSKWNMRSKWPIKKATKLSMSLPQTGTLGGGIYCKSHPWVGWSLEGCKCIIWGKVEHGWRSTKVQWENVLCVGQQPLAISTTIEPIPKPLCTSTQVRPSGKELIQTTNPWLFDGPFPLNCVHSGFSVEIGGLEWVGVVHGGIIMDTFPWVLDHSWLPLIKNPHGWNEVFPNQCWVDCQME